MANPRHTVQFRVRYSETDQMKTYYNSRALEWFEYGRTELCRALGKPYREMEQLGVLFPVSEARQSGCLTWSRPERSQHDAEHPDA